MDVNVLERGHGYTPVLSFPSPELAVFFKGTMHQKNLYLKKQTVQPKKAHVLSLNWVLLLVLKRLEKQLKERLDRCFVSNIPNGQNTVKGS